MACGVWRAAISPHVSAKKGWRWSPADGPCNMSQLTTFNIQPRRGAPTSSCLTAAHLPWVASQKAMAQARSA